MAQYAGKALKSHFGKDLTERQMIAIAQSGAEIFAGMLGKNPSEAAAAALVVMECDILRARGPSAEEERKKEEARKKAEEEQAAAEEAARLEKRRLQDEEIAAQNEKLRIDKEKLAAQEQERAAAQRRAAEEAARQPQVSYTQDDYRDMVNEAYGINPQPAPLPKDPRAHVQNQLQELGLGDDFGMEPGYHHPGPSLDLHVGSLLVKGLKNGADWLGDQAISLIHKKGLGRRPRSHSANARMAKGADAVNKVAQDPLGESLSPQDAQNRLCQVKQMRVEQAQRFQESPWEFMDMPHPNAGHALCEAGLDVAKKAAPVIAPVVEPILGFADGVGDVALHGVGVVGRVGFELAGYEQNVAKRAGQAVGNGIDGALLFVGGAGAIRKGGKAFLGVFCPSPRKF